MKFACPECSRNLEIPDEFAGQMGTCNHCGAKITVPKALEVKARKAATMATGLMDAVAPIKTCSKCGKEGGRVASHFREILKSLYCPDCAPEIDFHCPKCHRITKFKDTSDLRGVRLCEICIEKETRTCATCKLRRIGEPATFAEVRGIHYCKRCLEKNINTLVTTTTTPEVDGFRVKRYISIESVEYVIGTGIFSEFSTSIEDFFGARSSVFEEKLGVAKKNAMLRLKYLALSMGGNAVVGIDLDYTEFSGNRVALIVNGTVVEIEPMSGS